MRSEPLTSFTFRGHWITPIAWYNTDSQRAEYWDITIDGRVNLSKMNPIVRYNLYDISESDMRLLDTKAVKLLAAKEGR